MFKGAFQILFSISAIVKSLPIFCNYFKRIQIHYERGGFSKAFWRSFYLLKRSYFNLCSSLNELFVWCVFMVLSWLDMNLIRNKLRNIFTIRSICTDFTMFSRSGKQKEHHCMISIFYFKCINITQWSSKALW
jgi:hypothetical protein